MKKIIFVMPEFGTGGAERVVFNLLKTIPASEYEIKLVLFLKEGHLKALLPEHVTVESHNHRRMVGAIPLLWKVLRSDSDLVFCSGYHNLLSAFLAYVSGTSKKLVLRETSVASEARGKWKSLSLLKTLIPITYPICKKIIFQSTFGKSDFENFFSVSLPNSEVLLNPAVTLAAKPGQPRNVFLVGRLTPNKNHATALRAIRNATIKGAGVELFGDGQERPQLERFAHEEFRDIDCKFHGYVKGMDSHWGRCLVHVVTSRHESYPNVVIEAALAGVPSVCLLCPGGMKELFDIFNWGALVKEADALPRAIREVSQMTSEERMKLQSVAIRVFQHEAASNYLEFFRRCVYE